MSDNESFMLIVNELDKVLSGESSIIDLQILVDRIVKNDELPTEIPQDTLTMIYDLQTELELISVHQESYADTNSFYTKEQIIDFLSKYQIKANKKSK